MEQFLGSLDITLGWAAGQSSKVRVRRAIPFMVIRIVKDQSP